MCVDDRAGRDTAMLDVPFLQGPKCSVWIFPGCGGVLCRECCTYRRVFLAQPANTWVGRSIEPLDTTTVLVCSLRVPVAADTLVYGGLKLTVDTTRF